MNKEYKELEKDRDKYLKFIQNFCEDYCKDETDRKEFFKNLYGLIDMEIEMEKYCNT